MDKGCHYEIATCAEVERNHRSISSLNALEYTVLIHHTGKASKACSRHKPIAGPEHYQPYSISLSTVNVVNQLYHPNNHTQAELCVLKDMNSNVQINIGINRFFIG